MSCGRQKSAAKPLGTGRIVFWRGGSVWVGRADGETGFHAHHAIQVTLVLSGGQVRFQSPGENWASYSAAIIAADRNHAFEAGGQCVAQIFTEPESRDGRVLRQRYGEGIAALACDDFAEESAALFAAYEAGATDEELVARARAVTARLTATQASPPKPLDKRIARAIEVVRERLGEAITMTEIADAVHLSPERFRHLFLEETGVRFRPYVLWLRLEVAVASYAAGNNLTEASYAGGFADSAHFSRTFKRMFGLPAVGIKPVPAGS
ncbi:helix-turn-helix transcriptional regulator [Noviherbaspirillum sp. ST9]|uniref:helix-turn-helix transcriptional regulator n=1 Tax=Noviherbaspirillum sp. ST9 TaxID=3401606 RepID=UPI003B588A91